MRDVDLYAEILGVSSPWQVTSVDLRPDCLHRRNPVTVPIESGRRFRLKAVTDSEGIRSVLIGLSEWVTGMGRNREVECV